MTAYSYKKQELSPYPLRTLGPHTEVSIVKYAAPHLGGGVPGLLSLLPSDETGSDSVILNILYLLNLQEIMIRQLLFY